MSSTPEEPLREGEAVLFDAGMTNDGCRRAFDVRSSHGMKTGTGFLWALK